jgi:antitoxin SocA-like protein
MTSAEYRQLNSAQPRPPLRHDAFGFERVAEAAHYVIARAEPGKLGHVKLNRILWYADLEHYRWHGGSLTGLQQYSRTPQGPMSPEIPRAVGRLVKDRKVAERTVKVADFPRREMIALQLPEIEAFNGKQASILNQIIKIVVPLGAHQLGQMIEDDRLWQQVGAGQAMSIATGSIMTRPLTAG